jgi:hypothetical protein
MDPLITNGIDLALIRVVEKRGHDTDPQPRRRRPAASEKMVKEDHGLEPGPDNPKHALDDLA